jgi:hypothetical protein
MDTSNRSHILNDKLQEYYKQKDHFQKIYDISMNPKVSLRVVDWFVTNYSKKKNIVYDIQTKEKTIQFNVFTSYKSQLKSYSKRYFDPFCRRQRIQLSYKDKEIVTTIGQLNFFQWAISNNILDYIYQNYGSIDEDMNKSMVNHTKKKSKHIKRKELSKSSYKGLNVHRNSITLYFD